MLLFVLERIEKNIKFTIAFDLPKNTQNFALFFHFLAYYVERLGVIFFEIFRKLHVVCVRQSR